MSSRFPKEFKQEAVRLSRLDDRTCVEVADELGFNVENLYRWRREAREDGKVVPCPSERLDASSSVEPHAVELSSPPPSNARGCTQARENRRLLFESAGSSK